MERFADSIEAEIEELNAQIAEKRKLLEAERGIVRENAAESRGDSQRELVLAALKEKAPQQTPAALPASSVAPVQGAAASYLDSLDEVTATRVNELITLAFSKGIAPALRAAENEHPSVMDAFHDALADRLLSELKARNLIS